MLIRSDKQEETAIIGFIKKIFSRQSIKKVTTTQGLSTHEVSRRSGDLGHDQIVFFR